jgi:hypothetical protein
MIRNFIERTGVMDFTLLMMVFAVIIVISEVLFMSGWPMEAIFPAFGLLTIVVFRMYLKTRIDGFGPGIFYFCDRNFYVMAAFHYQNVP